MGVAVSTGGGSGTGGVRIDVDPAALLRSGRRMGSMGTQLGLLSDALGAALGSGIASGWDPAGANFGFAYSRQAQEFADALAGAANAFKALGYMLEATGYNYGNADAASTIGGAGPMGSVGGEPGETTAASAPTGPSGSIVPPPAKWTLIQPLLTIVPGFGLFASAAMTWPTGNPSLLRLTATQWHNIATGLSAFDDDVAALKTVLSQQDIPEGAKIAEALGEVGDRLSAMPGFASTIATSIDDFATGVQDTQDAIRRLLDRISLDGLWDTVTGFLTGEGDDILREIARDVGEVLENFQNQVKGVVGLLGELATLIGEAATVFQKWIRPKLVEAFGDDVGNALADTVTLYTDFQVGLVTGLINTVAGTVSLADPDTWKGMADVALSVAEDPSTLPGVLANMGKEFVAWDKWSGDHPGRAAGEAAFNIGSLFVPGGAFSKTGTLARGLSYTNRLLDEGRLPRLGDLPGGLGNRSPDPPDLDGLPGPGRGPSDVTQITPGPVPDSLIGPFGPTGVDAPTTPRGVDGPAGPPDPPRSTGTTGDGRGGGSGAGDGPPPDPPTRPVGPPEAGPAPSPPASNINPVDSQHISESPSPQTPGHAPASSDPLSPATPSSPEPPSPAGTHEAMPSPSDPGTSPASHAPTTSEAPQHTASSESHRANSEDYSGRPDDVAHTTTDQQSVRAEQSGGVERPTTDGGHRVDSTGPTSGFMAGGMPMAPHAPGGSLGSADAPSSTTKAQGPDTTRNPDAKGTQPGSPESPRPQTPSAAGPSAASTSAAPVDSTAGRPSGGSSQPSQSGAEPPSPRGPASDAPGATPNNPPHTGLHDPPANHGVAGDRLPDLSAINREFRDADGLVEPHRFDEWTRAVADAYPRIGQDGVAGVYDYTTENYQGMNPYLRDSDPLSPRQQSILGADSIAHLTDDQRSSWEERISDTDDGLAALPPYRADPADATSTTWRGMHASDELLAQLEVGGVFEDAAYLSTSLDSRVAEDFALTADPDKTPTLLSIEGHDGVDVAQLSRYTDEAEILFPRGSRFEVLSRDVGDGGVIHIVLRQLPS